LPLANIVAELNGSEMSRTRVRREAMDLALWWIEFIVGAFLVYLFFHSLDRRALGD